MKKTINNLAKLVIIPVLALGFNSCEEKTASQDFRKIGEYGGKEWVIQSREDNYENCKIFSEKYKISPNVSVRYQMFPNFVYPMGLKNPTNSLEKRHELYQWANQDSLEKIRNYVRENGEDYLYSKHSLDSYFDRVEEEYSKGNKKMIRSELRNLLEKLEKIDSITGKKSNPGFSQNNKTGYKNR